MTDKLVLASMAAMPSRKSYLEESLPGILRQVSHLQIYANSWYGERVPYEGEYDSRKLQVIHSDQSGFGDLGDAGKFFPLNSELSDLDHVRLFMDDDLLYPPDYAERMSDAVGDAKMSIFTAHGSILTENPNWPQFNYFRNRMVYAFFRAQEGFKRVDVGGTGVMACHSLLLDAMDWTMFYRIVRNCSDIVLAVWASANGIAIKSIPRPDGWIKELGRGGDSIFEKTKHTGEPASSLLKLMRTGFFR